MGWILEGLEGLEGLAGLVKWGMGGTVSEMNVDGVEVRREERVEAKQL
jgi:hypothetical protein